MNIKTILMLFLFNICLVETQASELDAQHILSIGDDGNLSYRYMVTSSLGASFGYYISDRERSNNVGQRITRDSNSYTVAVRINVNPEHLLRNFFQFEVHRSSVTYVGSTAEDYNRTENLFLFGMEYLLSDNFSVEGMFGYGRYETKLETEKETGSFGPTTKLAVNYLF